MDSFRDVDAVLDVAGRSFRIGRARSEDVAALVALLRDDAIGRTREHADLTPYVAAYDAVDADPAHLLLAVRDEQDDVVATVQLTLLPGLSRGGTTRLQLEGVRVGRSARGSGLGTALVTWAIDHGRRHGATLAQLTTDLRREEAGRFYERLGFVASHAGMKRELGS